MNSSMLDPSDDYEGSHSGVPLVLRELVSGGDVGVLVFEASLGGVTPQSNSSDSSPREVRLWKLFVLLSTMLMAARRHRQVSKGRCVYIRTWVLELLAHGPTLLCVGHMDAGV